MQGGDIDVIHNPSVVVVMEGVLCDPSFSGFLRSKLDPPSRWTWHTLPLKNIARYVYNNIPVEIVTFLGQSAADFGADWLDRYKVDVTEVTAVEFDLFCESLKWRINDVRMVVDGDWDRILRYGQKGYLCKGGEF